ncbi:hypothetical protein QO010_002904 [Caulobacter ginsengisoli]|uniref:DUF1206 domain-containing protein n=1 Tax=Caulobacter ginsengisoli TaxID=400775 RepID=A0ABU0IUR2_9CAUL|nr:hypothetical protein [Caulobacter ginsengisoli]MDQ0465120.1 hypothetical protein [Caulobacter ginsengisoli]
MSDDPTARLEPSLYAALLLGRPASLTSPLSVEECQRRINQAVDHPSATTVRSPVLGGLRNGAVWVRKRLLYQNPLQTVVTAPLTPDGTGTRLACHAAVSPLTVIFIVFALAVILMGAVHSLADMARLLHGEILYGRRSRPWINLIGTPVVLGLGYLLVRYLRAQATGDRAFLIAFLAETLEAEIVLGS